MASRDPPFEVILERNDREVGRFVVSPGQRILSAVGASDLGLTYGCQDGSCVRCIARLLDGEIRYEAAPTALSEDQREAGYVLLCIAHPETDCRLEIGRSVLEDAFPQLWGAETSFR